MPDGALPVFSTDTEEEARRLIVACCPRDHAGTYYARELAERQTLDNLAKFSLRLAEAHERLKERGYCDCKKENHLTKKKS